MRPCHPISHLPACSSLTSSQSYTKWPLRISAHPQIRVDCRIRSHTRSYCYVSRSGPPSDESFHIRMVQRQACQLCSSVAGWFVMGWVLGVVVGRCREESCREQGSASFFRLSGSHTPSSYGYPCPCSHIQTHGPWIVSLVCCIASHAPHAHPPPSLCSHGGGGRASSPQQRSNAVQYQTASFTSMSPLFLARQNLVQFTLGILKRVPWAHPPDLPH